MEKYLVSEALVRKTLEAPSGVVKGYSGRMIAQRKIDGYVLRVIYKEEKGVFVVVTGYKARSERHEG